MTEPVTLLTPQQAYLAMLEFLEAERRLCGPAQTLHLGGLLSEMSIDSSGVSADPGAVLAFADAVAKVLSDEHKARFEHFRWPPDQA
jgi:hypothetical protein